MRDRTGGRDALRPAAAHHPALAACEAGGARPARHGGQPIPRRGERRSRGAGCRRQRDRRRGCDGAGAGDARAVELGAGRHRLRAGSPCRRAPRAGRGFRPSCARRPRSFAVPADRADEAGPVRLAGGGGRHQYPRPAFLRDPLGAGRACRHARTLGKAAVRGGDRPGAGAGPARAAGRLVHHAQDRELRRRAAALSGKRPHLPARRPAAGGALSGGAGLLHARPSAGDAGAPGASWPARFLRGRDRGADRRGCAGVGRRAHGRGSARLPGARPRRR